MVKEYQFEWNLSRPILTYCHVFYSPFLILEKPVTKFEDSSYTNAMRCFEAYHTSPQSGFFDIPYLNINVECRRMTLAVLLSVMECVEPNSSCCGFQHNLNLNSEN